MPGNVLSVVNSEQACRGDVVRRAAFHLLHRMRGSWITAVERHIRHAGQWELGDHVEYMDARWEIVGKEIDVSRGRCVFRLARERSGQFDNVAVVR